MEIKINEKQTTVAPDSTLGTVLSGLGVTAHGIAASVNGKVIAPGEWDSTGLADGDSIVILKAFFGG